MYTLRTWTPGKGVKRYGPCDYVTVVEYLTETVPRFVDVYLNDKLVIKQEPLWRALELLAKL